MSDNSGKARICGHKIILLPKLSVISNMAFWLKVRPGPMTNDHGKKGKSEKLFIYEPIVPNGVFTVMIHQTLRGMGPILCD